MLPVVLGHSAFEKNAGKKYKSHKSFGESERITWRGRTSDTIGGFSQIMGGNVTSVDECLTLIRMKIQEKCHNTQELNHYIRRLKIGENKNITPNVFRATLIKFGLVFPEHLVSQVFRTFDKRENGTMNFDDFSTWVMSAEFDPRNPLTKKYLTQTLRHSDPMTNPILSLLQEYAQSHPFTHASEIKAKMSFLDVLSFFSSRRMVVSEVDIRNAFVLIDKRNFGFITLAELLQFAHVPLPEAIYEEIRKENEVVKLDLKTAITRVCGRKTVLVERCFSHIPRNEGVRLGFEEFKHCLVSSGLGVAAKDVFNLFVALGGESELGFADMDLLFRSLVPYAPDRMMDKMVDSTDISFRGNSASYADLRFREAVRKSYKNLRSALEQADSDSSGFVEVEVLSDILNRVCMPITYPDFRLVIRPIKTDERGRLSWVHFLSVYNPGKDPYFSLNPHRCNYGHHAFINPGIQPAPASTHHSHSHSHSHSGSNQLRSSNRGGNNVTFSPDTEGSIVTSPIKARKGLSSAPSLTTSSLYSTGSLSSDSLAEPELPALNITGGHQSQSATSLSLSPIFSLNSTTQQEIRKHWQSLLKECQRLDVDRTGTLPRSTFLLLARNLLHKTINHKELSKLADRFRTTDSCVEYAVCIRSCLPDLLGASPSKEALFTLDRKTLQVAFGSLK